LKVKSLISTDRGNVLWMTIEQSKVLAGEADRGCIDERQRHFHVVDDNSVEESFIACQQVHQVDVFVKIRGTSLDVQHGYLDLVFLAEDSWR